MIILSARVMREDDSGLAQPGPTQNSTRELSNNDNNDDGQEVAETGERERPEFHVNLRGTITSFVNDNCTRDSIDVGSMGSEKDDTTNAERDKFEKIQGELLKGASLESSPEINHPSVLKLVPGDKLLSETSTATEAMEEEDPLDKEFFNYMKSDSETEGETLEERAVGGGKRRRPTGTMTMLERELKIAVEKFVRCEEVEKNDLATEIEFFSNK